MKKINLKILTKRKKRVIKRVKKRQKNKNVANPNKKQKGENDIKSQNDSLSYFSEIKDTNSEDRINETGKKNKNKFVTDYILDKSSFNSKLLMAEDYWNLSLQYNILYYFSQRKWFIYFSFSYYIIFELLFIFKYILYIEFIIQNLFIDQDFDLEEETKGNYFFLNILTPCLLYIATSKIKQLTSIKEFINDKNYQYEKIVNNKKLNKGYKKIKIHDLMSDINKFKNKIEDQAFLVFIGGIFSLYITGILSLVTW